MTILRYAHFSKLKLLIIFTFDLCTEGIRSNYLADFKWLADRIPKLFDSLLLSLSDVTAVQLL